MRIIVIVGTDSQRHPHTHTDGRRAIFLLGMLSQYGFLRVSLSVSAWLAPFRSLWQTVEVEEVTLRSAHEACVRKQALFPAWLGL